MAVPFDDRAMDSFRSELTGSNLATVICILTAFLCVVAVYYSSSAPRYIRLLWRRCSRRNDGQPRRWIDSLRLDRFTDD